MSNTNVDEAIKVEVATVRFFEGLEVEGYKMPDGEFRIGLTGASLVLGYGENWLPRLLRKKEGVSLKALVALGFSKEIQKVVSEASKDLKKVKTISLEDFNKLIVYTVSRHKKAALALQNSLTVVSLLDFFLDAFGKQSLSIEHKRQLFYEKYAVTISPDGWQKMSKRDILRLALHTDLSHTQKNTNVIDPISPIDDSTGVSELGLITKSFIPPKKQPKFKDDFWKNWLHENPEEVIVSFFGTITLFSIISNDVEEPSLWLVYLWCLCSSVGAIIAVKLVFAIWRFFCKIVKTLSILLM
ncbi:hypothetical protein QUA27_25665 [Microcoleus sp. Pol14C6]|uniref:hypothetical protein n=1 Tax=unclassified Microcoleus TaxID=2642155 RepID=UPI002FD79ED6